MYTYWYLLDQGDIDKIQKVGLRPANELVERAKEYGKRNSGDSDAYFQSVYNKFYKPILKQPYSHYGIYTTPIDLPHSNDGGPKLRIRFETDKLSPLIYHLSKSHQFDKQNDAPEELITDFHVMSEEVKIEELTKFTPAFVHNVFFVVKTRRFRFLPQLVYFGTVPLRFTSTQIELW